MSTDQYHEPPAELSDETRTFARMCASLSEEAEAIGWYEQRIAVEKDAVAKAIMRDSLGEEYKHFSMELEFLLTGEAAVEGDRPGHPLHERRHRGARRGRRRGRHRLARRALAPRSRAQAARR